MSIVKELITYTRRPVFTSKRKGLSAGTLFDLVKLMGLVFLSLPFVGIIMTSVFMLLGQELPTPSQGFEEIQALPYFFVLAVIYAPLAEELLFRAWLGSRRGMLLWLPVIVVVTAVLAIAGIDGKGPLEFVLLIAVIGALGLYVSRYWLMRKDIGVQNYTATQLFAYLYWGSCLVFAFIHIGNFTATGLGLLSIIVVMPQFLVGIVLAFVRMRHGLIYAIAFHAAYNGLILSLTQLGPPAFSAIFVV